MGEGGRSIPGRRPATKFSTWVGCAFNDPLPMIESPPPPSSLPPLHCTICFQEPATCSMSPLFVRLFCFFLPHAMDGQSAVEAVPNCCRILPHGWMAWVDGVSFEFVPIPRP
jgi:hypothetical protein